MQEVGLVVACSRHFGIGNDGKLPWFLPNEMKYFKAVTSNSEPDKQNMVIMGRNTWDSIPEKFRPLANRINVVLTRNQENKKYPDNVVTCSSIEDALKLLELEKYKTIIDKVMFIGGSSVYHESMKKSKVNRVYLTMIDADFQCDTYFDDKQLENFSLESTSELQEEKGLAYKYLVYSKKNSQSDHEEYQYLNLVKEVITSGNQKGDRTGTGTLSLFGKQMRFDLRNNKFPLLTTKRVFWRAVAGELLWMIKGSTNSLVLSENNIHIWDGNSTREFLDNLGFNDRDVGDLGPVYGFQWRHFGAEYKDMYTDYTGQGIDQLAQCIDTIKNNPNDRRIIMCAWNPSDLKKMALPPCHAFVQFYVSNGELSCMMYQRSCDLGLGVPFNIASYALLTRLIAQVCGLEAGDFVHTLGDAHVYNNHIEPLQDQIQRTPSEFPTLKINPAVKDIDKFEFEDFEILGYNPQKAVQMKMAV